MPHAGLTEADHYIFQQKRQGFKKKKIQQSEQMQWLIIYRYPYINCYKRFIDYTKSKGLMS